jgi:hypothetical protein
VILGLQVGTLAPIIVSRRDFFVVVLVNDK